MTPPLRRTLAVATAAVLAALLLGSAQPAAAAPALPPVAPASPGSVNDPGGDAFYSPPAPLPAGRPGDVIRVRQITDRQWLIMYLSTNALGQPDAVTGTVLLPAGSKNPAALPLVAFAPGTQGPAFKCVASKSVQSGLYTEISSVNDALNQGSAVVVVDYEGYYQGGTPTYITGRSEGPVVLDGARAAQRLAPAGLNAANPVVIQGYSQGGGAAMWAGELQPTYAPELKLVGITAGGVPADLTATAAQLNGNVGFGFLAFAAIGLDAAYPELRLDSYLNASGRSLLATVKANYCTTDFFGLAGKKISDVTTSNPLDTAAWQARLAENKLGFSPPRVPVYQYLGALDEIVPVAQGRELYNTYCRAGVKISFHSYELAEHVSGFFAGKNEVQKFTADRIAGRPAPTTCP